MVCTQEKCIRRCAGIILDEEFRRKFTLFGGARVLLGRQRFERRLLLMALSGYASVYKMNSYFQHDGKKRRRLPRGTRG